MTNHVSRTMPMTPKARLIWLALLFVVQWLYFPINRAVQGGVVLDTPWDAYIPLWPIWAVPYLLSMVWWVACFVWAACKMDDTLYRAFVIGMAAVMLVSYAIYLLYPTYIVRPLLEGDTWSMALVRLIYSHDRTYNACPSGHTYTTVMICLFWCRWRPRQRHLWIGITIVVLLSTLFTGQHYLPDLVGGILLAWAGYHLSLWWARRMNE